MPTRPSFAVISDIHANWEALQAVLNALSEMEVDRIICLGDVVGYGPDPQRCVDAVRKRCALSLCGNHDFALIHGARDFSPDAAKSIDYHRALLMPRPHETGNADPRSKKRYEFLKSLPTRHAESERLFVHAAPRNPLREYLREIDLKRGMKRKVEENFELIEHTCFLGHTHAAGVITEQMQFLHPRSFDSVWEPKPETKVIINAGSVGQPRDGDPRACFITVHQGGQIRYHRVDYDVEKTVAKIERYAVMPPEAAQRLLSGS